MNLNELTVKRGNRNTFTKHVMLTQSVYLLLRVN